MLWIVVSLLAGAIFVADSVTNLEIAFAVLYVAVILIVARGRQPRVVIWVGVGCAILTIASFILSKHGAVRPGLVNCVLSLISIGATTVLVIRIEAASSAARRAQAELAHLSRALVMGELTTSIAHEVSQPLAAIVANSTAAMRWLSMTPTNEDEARRAMGRVATDAARAGAVISHARAMVRRLPASEVTFDLSELIRETIPLVRDQLHAAKILLRAELASDLPDVIGDRVQLQQVLLNMLMNGIEAFDGLGPDGRELVVAASAETHQVVVSVQDSGMGFPAGEADRAFETFYTTKPNGLGVGLPISRSIVERHGGTMSIAPRNPSGTVVGFTLPLRQKMME